MSSSSSLGEDTEPHNPKATNGTAKINVNARNYLLRIPGDAQKS